LKIFSGGYTPDPHYREGRTEGESRGTGTQLGRRGVVWDREGMRVIQRKGMGREEGKGRKDGRRMTWPPQKNSWIRHWRPQEEQH
jgi:hypothetical protein